MKVNVGISNHHVHLSHEDLQILFFEQLTIRNQLNQPGQFASEQVVDIVGPKGKLEKIRVLGPTRNYTQVEVTKTDSYKLGIDPPVRDSGNLENASLLTIIGPKGQIERQCGIIANRHIHVNECIRKEHDLVGINNASEYNHAIRDLKLADEIKNRYHICHISTKETVLALAKARETNKLVSGEACPHHLILTDENIKDLNPNYKMNPPLRSKADLEALIKGINDDVVTVIATDHAPHAIEEKNKPIDKAPFGIIGNQHAFSLMYTYIVKKGLISLEKVLTCMSLNPAKIIGIDHDLEVGKMANFVVFDLDEEYTITKDNIKSKSINTPFLDTKCYGVLKYHVLDGVVSEI